MPTIPLNWFILLPFVAGIAVTTQTAINGQLRTAVHSPLVAAFISFCVGTVLLGTLVLVTKQELPSLRQLSEIELYKFMGGMLGAIFITIIILSVQRLSVANIFALVVAGQFVMALIYDHFGLLGVRQSPITLTRLVGVASLILGAYLINRK
ncbi:DMT family transporter [Pontibacter sp. CAU 1760]